MLYWVILCFVVPCAVIENYAPSLAGYLLASRERKLVSSVTPTLGTYWILKILMISQDLTGSAGWDLVSGRVLNLDNVTIGEIWLTMISTSCLIALVVAYLSQVLPWVTGIPRPFYFPLMRQARSAATFGTSPDYDEIEDFPPLARTGEASLQRQKSRSCSRGAPGSRGRSRFRGRSHSRAPVVRIAERNEIRGTWASKVITTVKTQQQQPQVKGGTNPEQIRGALVAQVQKENASLSSMVEQLRAEIAELRKEGETCSLPPPAPSPLPPPAVVADEITNAEVPMDAQSDTRATKKRALDKQARSEEDDFCTPFKDSLAEVKDALKQLTKAVASLNTRMAKLKKDVVKIQTDNAKPQIRRLVKSKYRYWFPATQDPQGGTVSPGDKFAGYFQLPPMDAIPVITVQGLTKDYGGVVAVYNVDLEVYEGLITVILGHNGAGKTTVLNTLTGVCSPTSGTVNVCGYDVIQSTAEARAYLSFCQQQDVFFADLTVWEHLAYFGAVVILDEPTCGLDPETRREIWDLFRSMRHECTLLISTHDMAEADILGDRVVVLAQGTVQCSGSPAFLKKAYGAGYRVHITRKPSVAFQLYDIMHIIKSTVPEAEVRRHRPSEVTVALHVLECAGFEHMFAQLEEQSDVLGIDSIGVSVATIQDVFVK
ncbi:hypothetical protein HPB49_003304 [Dermacentor silvarum]|uniref:Uncharacterized protein n=1 Tax=Dermacentor silvarum TaxID=543639 RepID=A0ACB8DAL8_DERSI|nr:hypothetical protein HPB49_003304 [Dermacentor silvarum]